ncbi:MAG: PQQ-dependent sugar dehydrogenase, partial [Pseudomonadota bacterium]
MFKPLATVCLLALATPTFADIDSTAGTLRVAPILSGLDEPWGFGFLPDGKVVITERDGRLLLLTPGSGASSISGAPEVVARGQGGLLDVLVPRDFAQSRELFFTFSKSQGLRGANTAVAKATFSDDGSRLTDLETIFEAARGASGGRHFGSRLIEAEDGTIYLTIGDRGDRPSAQSLEIENGSVVRITRDGAIPADNPFARGGGQPGIWSFGHRNPQGMAMDAEGRIWTVEHGAAGGDEINLISRGANYGWPVISYGTHYSGATIGEGTEKEGLEQPAFYWDPSIAPSGMMIYSGALWPEWEGDIFVGSLKFDMISRLETGVAVREAERLASDETLRVRDIREAPDGSIWFLSIGQGALYRVS